MFIETHAHLTMPEYQDLPDVITRAKAAGVEIIINASFDLASSRQAIQMSKQYPFYIYAAVGIHPHDAQTADEAALEEIKKLAGDDSVIAIGETGLDYFRNLQPIEVQQSAFRRFLSLAQELGLPVIIHARDAEEDIIRIVREENQGHLRGVFHCFAGSERLIRFAKEQGLYISFAGMVTFKKAEAVRQNVAATGLSMLLLETDCPYLAPEPFRGSRNEPAYISYIAQKIAEIKKVTLPELAEETTKNAKKLFKI